MPCRPHSSIPSPRHRCWSHPWPPMRLRRWGGGGRRRRHHKAPDDPSAFDASTAPHCWSHLSPASPFLLPHHLLPLDPSTVPHCCCPLVLGACDQLALCFRSTCCSLCATLAFPPHAPAQIALPSLLTHPCLLVSCTCYSLCTSLALVTWPSQVSKALKSVLLRT